MKTIGLIGLGAMGGSYAKHLLANGFKTFGVDPDKSNSDLFSSYGGSIFDDINGLVKRCEVIILSVPTVSYSGTTTGSPDVYTEGSNTVLVYKINGTYTT